MYFGGSLTVTDKTLTLWKSGLQRYCELALFAPAFALTLFNTEAN